jgi:RecA-family ATPase
MGIFSIYEPPIKWNKTPLKDVSVNDVYKVITSTKYKAITEQLRMLETKEERTYYKTEKFHFATFSGTFRPNERQSEKVVQHSGLICVDIDGLEQSQLVELKPKILEDFTPNLMFVSPKGNGLKIVYQIDIESNTHLSYFEALQSYFSSVHSVDIDKACKDVVRACFLPYDDKAFYSDSPTLLDKSFIDTFRKIEPPKLTPTHHTQADLQGQSVIEIACRMVNNAADGEKHPILLKAAYLCGGAIASGELSQHEAILKLEQAISCRNINSFADAQKTILKGIEKGKEKPIQLLADAISQDNNPQSIVNKSLFKIKSANEWLRDAQNTPTPEMLFAEFWHEGEVCILFSDSNLGKSILAVQIANSISKGEQIRGFKLSAKKQKVLYFDFELSAKQFEVRYSVKNEVSKVFEQHYCFDDNFNRIEFDPDAEPPTETSFESYLNESLEQSIIQTGAKILIIDNITYLKNETERAKDALPLMKHLKALKNKYGLSILALAHTPKRDLSRPITQNDLQGSKMLYNFIDSCFSIGQSNIDKNLRYIKQIKARNTEMFYDTENIIICQVQKQHNFLEFQFLDFGAEREHLKQITEQDQANKISDAIEMKKQGLTNVEIAKQFGVSEGAVRKWLKKEN